MEDEARTVAVARSARTRKRRADEPPGTMPATVRRRPAGAPSLRRPKETRRRLQKELAEAASETGGVRHETYDSDLVTWTDEGETSSSIPLMISRPSTSSSSSAV